MFDKQKTRSSAGLFASRAALVRAGYRALAKKFHPDFGGDLRKIQALNAAMEKLRQ
jgi:curved DNA-binding protein CbpA